MHPVEHAHEARKHQPFKEEGAVSLEFRNALQLPRGVREVEVEVPG